jgi:uncharacterized protein YndB with AHSA1/START domain
VKVPLIPYTGTERGLGHRQIAAGGARSVVISQRHSASIERVWRACTDPNGINRWFIPPQGDLRPGGTFHLPGNASGTILRCTAPTLLTLSWVYGDKPDSEVELRLSADGDETRLELEHATVSDETLVELAIGWEMALDFLGMFLRGDLPDEPIPDTGDFQPTPEMMKLAEERAHTWGTVIAGDAGNAA